MNEDDKDTQARRIDAPIIRKKVPKECRGLFRSPCEDSTVSTLSPPHPSVLEFEEQWKLVLSLFDSAEDSSKDKSKTLSTFATHATRFFAALAGSAEKTFTRFPNLPRVYLAVFCELTEIFLLDVNDGPEETLSILLESHTRLNEVLVRLLIQREISGMDSTQLVDVVSKNIDATQERLVQSKSLYKDEIGTFLYLELQFAAILAEYDAFPGACELLGRCLEYSTRLDTLYLTHIESSEHWHHKSCRFVACCLGRKSLSLVHTPLGTSPPQFNLLYVCLYYAYKLFVAAKMAKSRAESALVAVFKANSDRLHSAVKIWADTESADKHHPVSCLLNETLMGVKLLLSYEDPAQIIAKHDLQSAFTQTVCEFTGAALCGKFVSLPQYDLASRMFLLLRKLQEFALRNRASSVLCTFCDDLVVRLLEFSDANRELFRAKEAQAALRSQLVDCATLLGKAALLQFIAQALNTLLSPEDVNTEYTSETDRTTDQKLARFLIRTTGSNREWGQELFAMLFKRINDFLKNTKKLASVVRLIYCCARNVVLDSQEFMAIITVTTTTHSEEAAGTAISEKPGAALLDNKFVVSLLILLVDAYAHVGTIPEMSLLILGNLALSLCGSAAFCEQLLDSSDILRRGTELYFSVPQSQTFFRLLLGQCLSALKSRKPSSASASSKTNYLPLILIETCTSHEDLPSERVAAILPIYDLLIAFLDSTCATLGEHQTALGKAWAAETLCDLYLRFARSVPAAQSGPLLVRFFAFLRGLLFRNIGNQARLRGSSEISLSALVKSVALKNEFPVECLDSILQEMQKIVFESPTEPAMDSRCLIRNEFFTTLYLSTMNSMMKLGLQHIAEMHLSLFMSAVEGSAVNSLILSSVPLIHPLGVDRTVPQTPADSKKAPRQSRRVQTGA